MVNLDAFRRNIDALGLAAEKAGLKIMDIDFLFCKPEILTYVAAYSFPSRFAHWSFGKRFERLRLQHRHGLTQIHELVCFAKPCLAFLSENNSWVENMLVAAHVIAHSDFFANNTCFKDIRRDAPELMARNKGFVQTCVGQYGVEAVEEILDAALALSQHPDLLDYLLENSEVLAYWEWLLLEMVLEETHYFLPFYRTRLLNEGWAAFWHTRLMKEMDLTEKEAIEFALINADALETRNNALNPYRLGFDMFSHLHREKGDRVLMAIRAHESDLTFFEKYLEEDMVRYLGLAAYGSRQGQRKRIEVSPGEIRSLLLRNLDNCGRPRIIIDNEGSAKGKLCLRHLFDGRYLNLYSARKTLEHLYRLWGKPVSLLTKIPGRGSSRLTFDGKIHRTM